MFVAILHSTPHQLKRRAARLALLLPLLALIAAALVPPAHAQDLPTAARLDGIRHVYQDWNNCGPANLTMALSYFGWTNGQAAAQQFLKPNIEDKNVTPSEMAQYVNEHTDLGVRAIWRYGGTVTLLKRFIAAGF